VKHAGLIGWVTAVEACGALGKAEYGFRGVLGGMLIGAVLPLVAFLSQ